jgi:hypothetical protein
MNIGDLVMSENSGKIGIITGRYDEYVNYWSVVFHDGEYSVHTSKLKSLEKK